MLENQESVASVVLDWAWGPSLHRRRQQQQVWPCFKEWERHFQTVQPLSSPTIFTGGSRQDCEGPRQLCGVSAAGTTLGKEEVTSGDQDGSGKHEGNPAPARKTKLVVCLHRIPIEGEHFKVQRGEMYPLREETTSCKSSINKHSKAHTGKKFQCSDWRRSCSSSTHFTSHNKIHIWEKAAHQDRSRKQEGIQKEKQRNKSDDQGEDFSVINPEKDTRKRKEKCLHYAKTFNRKSHLGTHQITHTESY